MTDSSKELKILAYLRKKINFDSLTKQEILGKSGTPVGYICNVMLKDGKVFTTGTHPDWDSARRIAIAEALETIGAKTAFQLHNRERLGLAKIPTTSGFAAGFEDEPTKARAICEGLERWAWSQWIDKGHQLPVVSVEDKKLIPIAQELRSKFTKIDFFGRDFGFSIFNENTKISFGVVIAHTRDGVFAGSRATFGEDRWTHALIECARNFDNFLLWNSSEEKFKPNVDWFTQRVIYFGRNKKLALEAIHASNKEDWPQPVVEILEPVPTEIDSFFLWRCLFKDFVPWHEGPVSRFVY